MTHLQASLLCFFFASAAFAQDSLKLSNGSGPRGGSVPLRLSLSAADKPATLQWTFVYSPTDVAALNLTAAASLSDSGKSLHCNASPGKQTCIVAGMNSGPIPDGDIVVADVTLTGSASGSVAVQVANPMAVSPEGSSVPISVSNGAISVRSQTPGDTAIRVNAGGPAYTDTLGRSWAADNGYSGGYTFAVNSPIAGTSNSALYQTLRWQPGPLQYQFAVPDGAYTVTLKFAEIYFSKAGQRRFSVAINGQPALTNFDIVAAAGGPNIAIDRSFSTMAKDGAIVIQLSRGDIDEPQINGIEIVSGAPVAVAVSPSAITLGPGKSQQFSASVSGTANTAVTWSAQPAVGSVSPGGLYTAPSTVSANQQVVVTATSVADPSATASANVNLTPAQSSIIRVNAGGRSYTDNLGRSWATDNGYSGGYSYSVKTPIANTRTPGLYQTLRWLPGTLQYRFAVPNGTYNVTLKFAEIYFTKAGQRRFSVAINGQRVLTNFDIVAAAGGPNIAIDRTFPATVTNGAIVIQFLRGDADDPQINAIEIGQ